MARNNTMIAPGAFAKVRGLRHDGTRWRSATTARRADGRCRQQDQPLPRLTQPTGCHSMAISWLLLMGEAMGFP